MSALVVVREHQRLPRRVLIAVECPATFRAADRSELSDVVLDLLVLISRD